MFIDWVEWNGLRLVKQDNLVYCILRESIVALATPPGRADPLPADARRRRGRRRVLDAAPIAPSTACQRKSPPGPNRQQTHSRVADRSIRNPKAVGSHRATLARHWQRGAFRWRRSAPPPHQEGGEPRRSREAQRAKCLMNSGRILDWRRKLQAAFS